MNKVQTLNEFWNGFGLKAYDENGVPDGTSLPYITYETIVDSFGYPTAQTASIWYRSSRWVEVTEKEMQIADFIGRGGRMLAYTGGAMWIKMANPWAQRMTDASDDMVKRIILNVEIEFID